MLINGQPALLLDEDPGGEGEGGAAGGESGGSSAAFHESIQDESLREWAAGKNWSSAEAAVKSAYHLEKMVGAPADSVLRVPQAGDNEAFRNVYSRLGMPQSPDKYDLPGAETGDETADAWLRQTYHSLGLSQDQALQFTTEMGKFSAQQQQAAADAYEASVASGNRNLQTEWGNGYERQMSLAKEAAAQLGFTRDVITGIEQKIGYEGTIKLMAEVGGRLGEDNFISGDRPADGGGFSSQMTPAQAKAAWGAMQADQGKVKALMDKRHPNHGQVMEEKANLFALMYPGQSS